MMMLPTLEIRDVASLVLPALQVRRVAVALLPFRFFAGRPAADAVGGY